MIQYCSGSEHWFLVILITLASVSGEKFPNFSLNMDGARTKVT